MKSSIDVYKKKYIIARSSDSFYPIDIVGNQHYCGIIKEHKSDYYVPIFQVIAAKMVAHGIILDRSTGETIVLQDKGGWWK